MKNLIASDASLSRMKFNELWPIMLDGYAQQFNFILRGVQVGIALTFSVDTSGCERLISLMNNLKTKFQEEMAHESLVRVTRPCAPIWFGGTSTNISSSPMSGKQCRNGRLFVGARRVGDIRVR
jgi:hypothetical protein